MSTKVFIRDWLELKPYNKPVATDTYYVQLSNKVKNAIIENRYSLTLRKVLDFDLLNNLSCFITSYLEDLVSETNIWNTFIKCHKEMYGKPLPFFDCKHYVQEEINVQDIKFLIWYYLNTSQDTQLIHPKNDFISFTAEKIMVVFDEVWEYAPPNEALIKFYSLTDNETDYYTVRNVIDTILYKTYLFSNDTAFELKMNELELFQKHEFDSHLVSYLNENRDNLLNSQRTALLAMSGAEWLAHLLSPSNSLYPKLTNISPRVFGYFFYKGQNEQFIHLEHVASGKLFKLDQRSFDRNDLLTKADEIVYLGMIRWDGNWWFSGNFTSVGFNADLVLDEKNSISSRALVSFLDHEQMNMEEVMQEQRDMFLAYTGGHELVFLEENKVQNFIEGYKAFSSTFLKLSEQEVKEAQQRAAKEGFIGSENDRNSVNSENLAQIYFNPKRGIEIVFNIHNAIPLPNNTNFNIYESEDDVIHVLTSSNISKELAEFCIEIGKDKLPFYNTNIGKTYLENLDFMLRFWKKEAYFSKPEIAFTGTNKS
ncbi:MAG: DUF3843 family protein [Bacteroidetes bacterium]|nr:DUF3843 family protein [Bacteroidota bacterium]